MIYIGLKRGTGFYSQLIRLWTRSKYSHAMVVMTDEVVISYNSLATVWEATAKQGVIARKATIGQLKNEGVELHRYTKFFADDRTVDAQDIRNKLGEQVGAEYDWTAIFYSRIFNIDRQESKKWFCFELVAWAFGMAKSWRWTGRTFQDKLEGVI